MSFQVFSNSPSPSLLCFTFVVLVRIQLCQSNIPDNYQACNKQFSCGNITASYPFWGGDRQVLCGRPDLKLDCEQDVTTMVINDAKYHVLGIDEKAQALKIARQDYLNGMICPPKLLNTTINSTLFDLSAGYEMFTLLYGFLALGPLTCSMDKVNYMDGFIRTGVMDPWPIFNVSVNIPIAKTLLSEAKGDLLGLKEALDQGFEVKLKVSGWDLCEQCISSRGSCGYEIISMQTICNCPNGQINLTTPCSTSISSPAPNPIQPAASPANEKNGNGKKLKVAAIAIASGAFGLLLVCIFLIVQRRKKIAAKTQGKHLPALPSSTTTTSSSFRLSQSIPSYPYSKSDLARGSNYFGTQVFSYAELEEATDNFDASKELGDGGFGTVYYGVLKDGREVAVKRLYENNFRRAEQFKNEIEILTRLRHRNLVTLYGCTSRHCRELILVYEYIPNGTVADHIHRGQSNSRLLTWPIRLNIAVETADALAYLHRTDIIHRDVKTNNILLDNNFHVKVADFGLSRFFPNNVTHVSTAPQGTPGYVDPEYYQCYQLTEKSDVYSFGVVLIELISSLQAVDTNRHRQDINLANMAVSRIQNHALEELIDLSLGFKTDYAVRNMMTSVAELAFRCLQQDREMRPTMQEVLENLKATQNQQVGTLKAEVVDFCTTDDVVLLKNIPPPISPDSAPETDKWMKIRTL